MKLYFLRHAMAAPKGIGADDADRPLTPEGIAKMKKAAAGLKKLELSPDAVISSLYRRARETAEVAVKGIGWKGKIQLSEALTPDAHFKDFLKLIKPFPPDTVLLLVGHQPIFGEFASHLVSGSSHLPIDIGKGGLCLIETFPGQNERGELKILLTSKCLECCA